MGLAMSKFLNTATHFSIDSYRNLIVNAWVAAADRFTGLSGETSLWGTEADTLAPLNGDIVITRIRAIAGVNSADQPAVITVRDDGADTAAVVSIPAGNTSIQDSGALNVAIAAGSLICLKCRSDFGAGGIDQVSVEVQYQRVIA